MVRTYVNVLKLGKLFERELFQGETKMHALLLLWEANGTGLN